MTWIVAILAFSFIAGLCIIVALNSQSAREMRMLLAETINHLSARNATDAAEAEAIKDRSTVELEMLKDVMKEQRRAQKTAATSLPADDEPMPQKVVTTDGRILHELTLDDF